MATMASFDKWLKKADPRVWNRTVTAQIGGHTFARTNTAFRLRRAANYATMIFGDGPVAQMGERLVRNQEARSSILLGSTSDTNGYRVLL